MKHEFQVGDVCRVRKWDDMFSEFGGDESYVACDFAFVRGMSYMCGETFTIASIEKRGHALLCHSVEGIENGWNVGTDMLELTARIGPNFEGESIDVLLACLEG